MATNIVNHEDNTPTIGAFSQSVVTGTKAAIDSTWSVLSFVLASEAEWPGYESSAA